MRRPVVHTPASAITALVIPLAMMSCAAEPIGAKEQTSMSAALQERQLPFQDPAVVPMAEAVAAGDAARIRTLAASTDLTARGQDNVTLLEWAIWNEQPDALAALLEAGADASAPGMDQDTVAHMAAMVQDPKYLRVLIEHGAPVDDVSARAGWTPVFRAVQSRRDAQVDMLIKAGADVKRTDSMGNSLAHVAANINDANRVLQLLEAGVDPRATNARVQTFQASLFLSPDAQLSAEGKAARQSVRDWLAAQGIAQE